MMNDLTYVKISLSYRFKKVQILEQVFEFNSISDISVKDFAKIP